MCALISSRTGRQFQLYVHGCRQVVGCIPYRYKNNGGELEVLLISSQKGPALFFPKGGWEIDEYIEAAVSREAEEEAGVVGIVQCPLGAWRFKSKSQEKFHEGYMFSFLVTEELDVWPEKDLRQRIWMSVSEAREALSPLWMKEALDKFVYILGQEQRGESITIPIELLRIEGLRQIEQENRTRRQIEQENRTLCAYHFRTEEQRIGIIAQNGEEMDCC